MLSKQQKTSIGLKKNKSVYKPINSELPPLSPQNADSSSDIPIS